MASQAQNPIAEGSTQYFAYKVEDTENQEASGTGAQVLRRVTGQLDLQKAEVVSAEKRTDFQDVNVNHGTRSVNWRIDGELFGGDYDDFIAAAVRRDYSSLTDLSPSMTVGSAATATDSLSGFDASTAVLNRAAGDFITDGLREGMIVRLNGGAAGNAGRNFRIIALTDTDATLLKIDGGADIVDDGSGPTSISVPGAYSFIPSTGHLRRTFTLERYDSQTDVADVGCGNKVGVMDLSAQPDQPVGLSFNGIGINRRSQDGAHFTSPAASGVGPAMASAIGFARVEGHIVAVATGLTLNLDNGINNRPVAFSNVSPNVFYGRTAQVTGTVTVLKQGRQLSDLFDNETEVTLEFYIEAPGLQPRAFFNVFLPRVKLNSADADDPDGPVVETFNFRAIKPTSGTGLELSTFLLQDSSAGVTGASA